MTDSNMLELYIKKSGYRIYFIAEKLGLTYQGLKNKIDNKSEFTQSEIVALSNLLNIDNDVREKIFFANIVDKTSTQQ